MFKDLLGSGDHRVIPWQSRSDIGVHLEPFHTRPKGQTYPGQDSQDKDVSTFSFDAGSKPLHFLSLDGMRTLVATSRAKVRVLRQKSIQGLKWEALASTGP